MVYKLFIDDERLPPKSDWIVARSYKQAVTIIEQLGCPNYMSFDHDLGNNSKDGLQLAKWLISKDLNSENFFPQGFTFEVHSANPVGKENIIAFLQNYLSFKNKSIV